MAKENNKNKTINFAEKKKAYASKKAQNKSPQTMPEGKMVYDINRMREQINQQTRNLKNKKLIKKSRPAWVVLVYLLIITAIVVLTGSKIYNAALNYRTYGTMPEKFTSIDNSLSTQDTIKYEQLIKKKILSSVKSDTGLEVITSSIHRNGQTVYANGYFTYANEKDKIYFDSIIRSEKIESLQVNGFELTKIK
nr:hypothetical protein [uncultured Peptostreptococcus sp.]